MIDWNLVFFGALWIGGLSICLAAVSFAYSRSAERQCPLRTILRESSYQQSLNFGLLLFCLGWLGHIETWWERGLWGALALSFAWSLWQAFRQRS